MLPTICLLVFSPIFKEHMSIEQTNPNFITTFFSHRLDVQYETIDYLYTPTYTRIGAYFIGVVAGWYLSHYDRKMNISKVITLFTLIFKCGFLFRIMHSTIDVGRLRIYFGSFGSREFRAIRLCREFG